MHSEESLVTTRFPFLVDIPRQEWQERHGRVVDVPAGTVAFTEGEQCEHVAFVLTGRIRVFKLGVTGREISLYRVAPGDSCVLMLSSVMADTGYPAHAVVEEDAKVLFVSPVTFRSWIDQYPSVRQFVYMVFSRRMESMMTLIEEVVFQKLDRRLARTLLAQTTAEEPELRVTHDELAFELGTAREVVSRVIRDFERDGMVHQSRGHVRVLDRPMLERRSEGQL